MRGFFLLLFIFSGAFVNATKPNIVYIISDDQYFGDFGFMGNEDVLTPHLDRLANQSAVYPNGYVPSSVCRPSLVSMLTGLYPHQHGVHFNHPPPGFQKLTQDPEMTKAGYDTLRERGARLIQDLDTLPRLLAQNGYRCLQTGKYWEGHWSNAGFTEGMTLAEPSGGPNGDKVLPNGETVAHGNGDAGLAIGRETMQPIEDFIDDCGTEQPFFIWYAPFLPHTPHDSPQRYQRLHDNDVIPKHKRAYYAAITHFDDTVGELIQMIESRNLARNTLFVFVVDNGFEPRTDRPGQYTKRSKRSPFEPGIRTPILLRFDGRIQQGIRDGLVSSLDLYPTALAVADVETAKNGGGINLMPSATSPNKGVYLDRVVFGEIYPGDASVLGRPSTDVSYLWIRLGSFKLIRPISDSPWNNYVSSDQLFDLSSDSRESRNLAMDPDHAAILSKLRQRLVDWWNPIQ